jgi:hypothetical protein
MVHVRAQTPNEPSLCAGAHVLLGLALTPINYGRISRAKGNVFTV